MSDVSKKLGNVNTREYWVAAVNDPTKYGLSAEAVNIMGQSLDLTDPQYLSSVLADPEAHGFAPAHAAELARHFSKVRKDIDFGPSADWFDVTLDAGHWVALSDVSSTEAAMLLCSHNPNESSFSRLSSDETGSTSYEQPNNWGDDVKEYTPKHLRMLKSRLDDVSKAEPRPRTLRDWHQTAKDLGLTYHSWIDEYFEVSESFVAQNTGPAPLSTSDVAFCFDGLHWMKSQWMVNLGKKPKWLQHCIAFPGRQGVSETRWNPVSVGDALARKHIPPKSIRARFQSQPQLKAWLDGWKDHESQYLATE